MTTAARIPSPSGHDGRDTSRLTPWLNRHAVIMLVAIAATVAAPSGVWVALAGAWSFVELWYRERARHALLEPYGGWANQLTALRLGFVLAAVAFGAQLPTGWLWLLLAANVVIDVGDGYVARRRREVTAFGAVFDREVDALFVLAVYEYLFLTQALPAWVLIAGSLPYAFRLAVALKLDRPAPEQRERLAPMLAGVNFAALLIAVASPAPFKVYVAVASMALVAVSFLVSFVKLYRHDYSAA